MKVRNYLDLIESKKVLEILRPIVQARKAYTGRQLSYMTGLNNKTCTKYLDLLSERDILKKESVGHAYYYSLQENYYTQEVLVPLILQEQKLYETLVAEIRTKFSKYCLGIVIFGSYAKRQEDYDSDLDLCLIVKEKGTQLEKELDRYIQEVLERYGLEIEPYVLSLAELKEKRNLAVIKEIRQDGEWIYGDKTKVKEIWRQDTTA